MMLGRELAETTSERAAGAARQVGDVCVALRRLWQDRLCRAVRSRAAPRRSGRPRRPARFGPHRNGAAGVRRRARRQRAAPRSTASRSGCSRRATRSPMASAIAPKSARPRASSPISPCAKTSCWRCRPSAASPNRCLAREQDEIADALHQAARHPPAGAGAPDRAIVRRQPAEGAAGPLARYRAARPGARRTDARHRCRRPCRDHPPDPRICATTAWRCW